MQSKKQKKYALTAVLLVYFMRFDFVDMIFNLLDIIINILDKIINFFKFLLAVILLLSSLAISVYLIYSCFLFFLEC